MMAIGLVGGLVSAFGTFQSMMYQSAVAKANAKQAKLNAQLSTEVAGQDAEDLGTEARGQKGQLLAGQGASGISVASPSAVRSRMWMNRVAYKDQLRRTEAGARESANFRTQSNVFKAESKAKRTGAFFNLAGGVLGAVGGAMGSGGGGSLVGGAQPTSMSPGFLPIPRRKPAFRGLNSRGNYVI